MISPLLNATPSFWRVYNLGLFAAMIGFAALVFRLAGYNVWVGLWLLAALATLASVVKSLNKYASKDIKDVCRFQWAMNILGLQTMFLFVSMVFVSVAILKHW